MLIQITAPHFCAGIDTGTGWCAPIIYYMRFWSLDQIQKYCVKKNWTYKII